MLFSRTGSRFSFQISQPRLSKELEGRNPKIEDTEVGFENFCVIESKIYEMEWLYLASQGHRRALIKINEEDISAEWLTP